MKDDVKFYVFAIGPIMLVLWLLIGLAKDFVFSTLLIIVAIIGSIIVVKYLEWVCNYIDNNED
jgi:glucose uptake protein GlcU